MNHALNLRQPLAQNATANPLDVLNMKSTLSILGHYEAPEWGVTQFPDAALYTAITDFQKSAGLKVDGVMKPDGPTEDALRATLTNHQSATALHITARTLQGLGRKGDEVLAHITPAEAQLLHRVTDGASINPKTGLLEFWYDYEADAAASVLGDTFFTHGTKPAATAVQAAINAVSPGAVKADKIAGSDTLAAFDALASDPKTKNDLLNALADARWELAKSNEDISNGEKLGWKDRIDSYRP